MLRGESNRERRIAADLIRRRIGRVVGGGGPFRRGSGNKLRRGGGAAAPTEAAAAVTGAADGLALANDSWTARMYCTSSGSTSLSMLPSWTMVEVMTRVGE